MSGFTKLAANVCMMFAVSVSAGTSETTFTYQGELKENGGPASGSYDMSFSLWDNVAGGNQIGAIVDRLGVVVAEGRFTVQLDMGAGAFDNGHRWLEISVGGIMLSPRQPITRSPYSIQTRGIFVDENHNVGIGTTTPLAEFHIHAPGSSTGDFLIGSPAGSPGLTGIANNGHRRDIRFSETGLGLSTNSSSSMPSSLNGLFIHESGDVGIGTTNPTARLSLIGDNSDPVLRAEMNGSGPGLRLANDEDSLDMNQNSINTRGDGLLGDPLFLNNDTTNAVIIGNGGGNCGVGGASANLPLVKLHIDGGSDASPANPVGGYVLVGASTGENIVMDSNEIMARNNGSTSTLFLNNNGGNVVVGGLLDVGWELRTEATSSGVGIARVLCTEGKRPVGGGCQSAVGLNEIEWSFPFCDEDGCGWNCKVNDNEGAIAYVVCANLR